MSITVGNFSRITSDEYVDILEGSEEICESQSFGRTLIHQLMHPIYGKIVLMDGGMTDEKAMIKI